MRAVHGRDWPSHGASRPTWVHAAVFAAAYAVAAEAGYALWLGPGAGATFWPPAGVALALLLWSPTTRWPALIAAGLAVDMALNLLHGQPVPSSIGYSIANLAEAALGAWLVRRLFGERFSPTRLPEVLGLSAVSFFITAPVGAAIGAAAQLLDPSHTGFPLAWRTWWIGDAVGVLVVAPLVLRAMATWRQVLAAPAGRWLEAAALAALLVAVTQVIFTSRAPTPALPFLTFPVLLWASLRFGILGVTASLCLVALLTTRDTAAGGGPFALPTLQPGDRVVALQLFIGVMALSFQVLAVIWDERTRATRALRAANAGLEARYRRLVEQSPLTIQAILPDGRIKQINRAWERLWGLSIPEGSGYNVHDDARIDDLGLRPFLNTAFAGEVADLPELLVPFRDGTEADGHFLRGMAYPVKDDQGRVEEIVVICRDITEQVRAQRKLEEANRILRDREEKLSLALGQAHEAEAHREQLLEAERFARGEVERASRLKDEFLASLSHELRTPLNAILGWAQLLQRKTPEPAMLAQAIDTIERNARAQARLIEELLDMSRITSGRVELAVQRVELGEVVRAAVDSARPAAETRELRLTLAVDPGAADAAVIGDAARLQQVMANLVSNAIKFTPAGGHVAVRLDRRDGHAQVEVRDSGQGIPPEFLPHVFERFRQADGSITRRHGGLGLGLAIVKQIVELHHGEITAHSDGDGLGSTFTLTLPLAPAEHPDAEERPSETSGLAGLTLLAGLRVLVVDDEPDARELLRMLLTQHGCEVAVAESADDALAHLDGHHPHLLLSDIGMPRTDGYELLRRVRARPNGPHPKAVAVTAFARPEDRDRALAAGYDAHLAKPITSAALLQALVGLTADGRG